MRETDLDDLFAQARGIVPPQDTALMARVYADAVRLLPERPPLSQPLIAMRPGWWSTLFNAVGGRRGLAGLGTAAVAGVMLGLVQPTSVLAFTETFFATATVDEVDLMPGIDAILTEG